MSTLDRETLRKIRRIRLHTRLILESGIVGSYHAAFKGRGMEFAEVREYQPGDDVRTIDWNVTARTGDPYVKMFTEERELTILLMIDVSASSDFGSVADSKRELAAEAAGVLAASAVRNRDKVGLVLFSEGVELYIPPAKGRSHVLRLIREALFFQPEKPGTNISAALDFVNRVITRRAVVFLVSDFCPGTPLEEKLTELRRKLRVTSRHHDVIAVSVTDPCEEELPDVGRICVEDAETGQVVELNTSREQVREAYRRQSRDRRTRTASAIRASGVDLMEFTNGTPWMPELVSFFRKRRQRTG